MDGGLQVQLEEDGDSSTKQSWVESGQVVCSLCPVGSDKAYVKSSQ